MFVKMQPTGRVANHGLNRLIVQRFRPGFAVLLMIVASSSSAATSPCPCENPQWCEPISGPPVRESEVFGFYGSWVTPPQTAEVDLLRAKHGLRKLRLPIGNEMNWTHVTTVAWADRDEIMCLAHKHGARAILGAPAIHLDELSTPSARDEWIQNALLLVQDSHRDGLVFDYEDPQPHGSIAGYVYAMLISETRDAFHAVNPSYQISTCVPWSPDGIDGRVYPYLQISAASDLLYVMDYDTRSQIFDACLAGANAPLPGMINGFQRWFDLGVDPSKLVLGVPWYGYRYPCLNGTAPNAVYCPIAEVPFRGVNCSDAAGREVMYSEIQKVLKSSDTALTGGVRRDSNTGSLFFNSIEKGKDKGNDCVETIYQYWFDDPVSLAAKFTWARYHNLRGVGPYVFQNLDPIGAPEDALAMWSTFDVFTYSASYGRLRRYQQTYMTMAWTMIMPLRDSSRKHKIDPRYL